MLGIAFVSRVDDSESRRARRFLRISGGADERRDRNNRGGDPCRMMASEPHSGRSPVRRIPGCAAVFAELATAMRMGSLQFHNDTSASAVEDLCWSNEHDENRTAHRLQKPHRVRCASRAARCRRRSIRRVVPRQRCAELDARRRASVSIVSSASEEKPADRPLTRRRSHERATVNGILNAVCAVTVSG